MPSYSYKIDSDYSLNERLDKYIASKDSNFNRSKLKSGLNLITVNGKKQKISYKVKAGDLIYIEWEDNVPDNIEAQDIPLNIIYEDENVTVVNKEQGMVTHPAAGNWTNTLVNALLYHWGRDDIKNVNNGDSIGNLELRRPGIVHRLDKDTSGIIITAKNRESEEWLHNQFLNHKKLYKEYICICIGRPQHQHGLIKTGIIRDPKDRKRFKAVDDLTQGKCGITAYNCIACYGDYSLMRVRIYTGRTHQIRVHMKYLNCPILGDAVYAKKDKEFPNATLMLHARKLKIVLPGQKENSVFTAPVPLRFTEVEKTLKKRYSKVILDKNR